MNAITLRGQKRKLSSRGKRKGGHCQERKEPSPLKKREIRRNTPKEGEGPVKDTLLEYKILHPAPKSNGSKSLLFRSKYIYILLLSMA